MKRACQIILDMDEAEVETKIKEKNAMLHEWRNMAKNYSWLHQQCHHHFQKMNMYIMVPIILLSTTSGAINFTQVSNNRCHEHDIDVLSLVLGTMGLIAAGLSTVYNFMRIGERIESHSSTASDFEKLARDISVQTLLSNTADKTYANLGEFIKECNDRFNRLVEMAPVIPDRVYGTFEKNQSEFMKKHLGYDHRSQRSLDSNAPISSNTNVTYSTGPPSNQTVMTSMDAPVSVERSSPHISTVLKSPFRPSILFPTKNLNVLLTETSFTMMPSPINNVRKESPKQGP